MSRTAFTGVDWPSASAVVVYLLLVAALFWCAAHGAFDEGTFGQ